MPRGVPNLSMKSVYRFFLGLAGLWQGPGMMGRVQRAWRMFRKSGWPGIRWELGRRIASKMDKGSAGLGAAMITGYQAWISEDEQQTLRNSGLAHIILAAPQYQFM